MTSPHDRRNVELYQIAAAACAELVKAHGPAVLLPLARAALHLMRDGGLMNVDGAGPVAQQTRDELQRWHAAVETEILEFARGVADAVLGKLRSKN